jgi:hypothetical protein
MALLNRGTGASGVEAAGLEQAGAVDNTWWENTDADSGFTPGNDVGVAPEAEE